MVIGNTDPDPEELFQNRSTWSGSATLSECQCSGFEIDHFRSGSEINYFGSGSSIWKSWISDPDPSVIWDGEKKWSIFVIMKTQIGWNLERLKIFQVLCMKLWWICSLFGTFLNNIVLSLVWKRGGSGSGAGSGSGSEINHFGSVPLRPNIFRSGRIGTRIRADPDSDPGGSGSGSGAHNFLLLNKPYYVKNSVFTSVLDPPGYEIIWPQGSGSGSGSISSPISNQTWKYV